MLQWLLIYLLWFLIHLGWVAGNAGFKQFGGGHVVVSDLLGWWFLIYLVYSFDLHVVVLDLPVCFIVYLTWWFLIHTPLPLLFLCLPIQ